MILPTVESLGYELWGCVYVTQGQRSVLRVYIESPEEGGGIRLIDCERVSRQISALFDVENPISTRYTLEVSSPGLDRPLFTPEQFQRFVGCKISVRTHTAIDNQRKFKALLKSTSKNGIVISPESKDITLTWDNIMNANVLPETIK